MPKGALEVFHEISRSLCKYDPETYRQNSVEMVLAKLREGALREKCLNNFRGAIRKTEVHVPDLEPDAPDETDSSHSDDSLDPPSDERAMISPAEAVNDSQRTAVAEVVNDRVPEVVNDSQRTAVAEVFDDSQRTAVDFFGL